MKHHIIYVFGRIRWLWLQWYKTLYSNPLVSEILEIIWNSYIISKCVLTENKLKRIGHITKQRSLLSYCDIKIVIRDFDIRKKIYFPNKVQPLHVVSILLTIVEFLQTWYPSNIHIHVGEAEYPRQCTNFVDT